MRKEITAAFAAAVVSAAFASTGELRLDAGNTEVLVAPKAPDTTLFAAEEMTNFLSRIFGREVPLVRAPTPGRAAVVVGTNAWASAAGVDPSALKRDGFVIRTDAAAKRVYVAGCDDPCIGMRRQMRNSPPDPWGTFAYERASSFAVYDFLERFAGVRFYFPGEIGTIVPPAGSLTVPATDLKSEPDWSCRIIFSAEFGEWPDKVDRGTLNRLSRLEQLRLRHQTESFNSCHGQYRMNMATRFGKTHPEYFTMRKDGTRMNNPSGKASQRFSQHLCQSSDVWEEMYKDAKSYFAGESADKRGALGGLDANAKIGWGSYARYRKQYDVMPNDGHPRCHCDKCQAAYAKAKDQEFVMTELVWGQTVRLANRIKADGFRNARILQAAYADYRAIPDVDIPDNVIVNLCLPGPYSAGSGEAKLEEEFDEVRRWSKKANGNLWMWIYPGKFRCFNLNIPDVPNTIPRALAKYLQTVAPYVLGVFPQPYSDRFIYHYIDFYIYSRIAWDNDCDADAILDEHYRLMYGGGAKRMEELFSAFEDTWLHQAVGKVAPTPWGFTFDTPDEHRLLTEIFTPAKFARLEALAAEALAATPAGSMEAKRVKYVCDRMLGPLAKRMREYPAKIAPASELEWRRNHKGDSLIRNGSFDGMKGWGAPAGQAAVDTEVFFSAPSSIRIISTNSLPTKEGGFLRAAALQSVKLKPSTKYRISGFMKLRDVKPVCAAGGVDILVSEPVDRGYPIGKNPSGTRDWFRFAYEFTTPKEFAGVKSTFVGPRIIFGSGTAWVDDIRLDEITDKKGAIK